MSLRTFFHALDGMSLANSPYNLLYNPVLRPLIRKFWIDSHRIKKKVANYNLIFVINSGRVGSKYLAHILNSCPEIIAKHEPNPAMIGCYLKAVLYKPCHMSYSERRVKLFSINRELINLPDSVSTYVETNHMFIKTFSDVVMDYYTNCQVILLRRDLSYTLKSMMELGLFSNKNPHWKLWMYVPQTDVVPNNTEVLSNFDQYDRCIAYLLDIERKAQNFISNYPNTQVLEVNLHDLAEKEGVQNLFTNLGYEYNVSENWEQIRRTKNARTQRKAGIKNSTSLEYCKERILSYYDRAKEWEIELPFQASY